VTAADDSIKQAIIVDDSTVSVASSLLLKLLHAEVDEVERMPDDRKSELMHHAEEAFRIAQRISKAWAVYSDRAIPSDARARADRMAAARYVRQILELECTTAMSEGDTLAAISSHVLSGQPGSDAIVQTAHNIWNACISLRVEPARVLPHQSLRAQLEFGFATAASPVHTHEIIMDGLLDNPGEFRSGPAMASGSLRRYRAPEDIQSSLLFAADSFMDAISENCEAEAANLSEVHLLISNASSAAMYLTDFLLTHPFKDGNGRTARALVCALLGQSGPGGIPFTVLPHDGRRSSLLSALETSRKERVASVGIAALTHMILLGMCDAVEAWCDCVQVVPVAKRVLVTSRSSELELSEKLLKHRGAFDIPPSASRDEIEGIASELFRAARSAAQGTRSVQCSTSISDVELRFEVILTPFGRSR
jgi:hypothetical protein